MKEDDEEKYNKYKLNTSIFYFKKLIKNVHGCIHNKKILFFFSIKLWSNLEDNEYGKFLKIINVILI